MWHIKYDTKTLVYSDKRTVTYRSPFLENDEGVCIRKIGGGPAYDHFQYSGTWTSQPLLFAFKAPFTDDTLAAKRYYQVDLSNSLLRLPILDHCSDADLEDVIRHVILNITEALMDFPKPDLIGPHKPNITPMVEKITFVLSLSPYWQRVKHLITDEAVL